MSDLILKAAQSAKLNLSTTSEKKLVELIEAEAVARSAADEELSAEISTKADKATTLAGYGITDAYTKEEVRSDISWLQVWCEENEYAIDDLEQK
ncbi:MAG: hypothetical protein IJ300_14160, partial [Clostridia bacterium]|nr:hypothetical protein [Clostridia bacterium]